MMHRTHRTPSLFRRAIHLFANERASSLVETALTLPVLVLMLCAAVDLGRACTMAIAVDSAAQAGALYGITHPTAATNPSIAYTGDTAGMVAAATLDAANWPVIIPTATFGCQCSDGTGDSKSCIKPPSPSCTDNIVNYVQVTTTAKFNPLLPYPGLPSPFTINSVARLRASQ
jgi:Flp pilus assembly protein TadG